MLLAVAAPRARNCVVDVKCQAIQAGAAASTELHI